MKRIVRLLLCGVASSLCAVGSAAEVAKVQLLDDGYQRVDDIAYYDRDMPFDGNEEYLRERCRLDVYSKVDTAGEKLPVIVFFHGGGLSTGTKTIPDVLRKSNLVIVSPNYRLSSDRAKCPDYLYDAAAAMTWVFRHIAEYGGDPEQVFISGASGGAYLAMMVGMDAKYLGRFKESNRKIAGIMPVSGQATTHFQIINERNHANGMAPPLRAQLDEYAPLWHASADLPPIRLYTGDAAIEWPTRAEENALMAATLVRIGGHKNTKYHQITGFDHGDVYTPAFLLIKKEIAMLKLAKKKAAFTPYPPVKIDEKEQGFDFLARYGEKARVPGRVSFRRDGEFLNITVIATEPAINQLKKGPTVWEGDCVELFLETSPGKFAQWGVAPDGRNVYVSLGGENIVSQISVKQNADSWQIVFRVPLDKLPDNSRCNLVRRRMAAGDDSYTVWSPIFAVPNYTPDDFGSLRIR